MPIDQTARPNTFDVIVVGLGAMGGAALYQLSKHEVSVLGIDRFTPPHAHGSSHGDTRITRQAIGEGDAYTPFALRSYELWNEMEQEAQTSDLLTVTGGLILSRANADSALHGRGDFRESTLRSARNHRIAHETLTVQEMAARFPPFLLRGDEVGYYEEKAGFLRPERCVSVQLELARQNGARVHPNEQVVHFSQTAGGGVTLTTDKGTYHTQKLILAAGPWIADFLPAPRKPLFQVYRQVLYWFDVSDNYDAFTPGHFPVFIWDFGTPNENGSGEGIYGFPAIDGRYGGLKVATEQYVSVTNDPLFMQTEVSDDEKNAMYDQFVGPRLAGVNRTCVKAVACLYTVTPDHGFVIDAHPDAPDVLFASPCSGHGFKHSAAIGEALAQKAVTGKTTLDLAAFSLRRFTSAGGD